MKNGEGKTAALVVREALLERPDAFALSETEALLQVRAGAKPLPIATEIEYAVGDAVHHKKLGDGIVESVRGEGPEARFGRGRLYARQRVQESGRRRRSRLPPPPRTRLSTWHPQALARGPSLQALGRR